ncbi:thiolase-like protein [Lactarius pseudohatsudake]|nr:thiolase-like protein [Lactarius pseudohatsudake]
MGLETATKALLDAGNVLPSVRPSPTRVHSRPSLVGPGITYDSVEAAFVGYVYGASTTGQAALYQLGLTGIPITNVNNCSTGSTALVHAAALVRAGDAHCALALGFERMVSGALGTKHAFPDRPSPMGPLLVVAERASPDSKPAATEYFRKYGGGVEHLAKIAAKNHKHFSTTHMQFGYDEAADGATCCILANEAFVHANGLENQAIELLATGLATDYLDAFAGRSAMDTVGYGMTRRLADMIFAQAGASRDDVGVVELHDCFAANELVTYPALGLCAVDDAHRFVERGDNTYGGKYVVNPSGGLEAKGHPLGATGLAMHFSITKGTGPMQAPGLFDLADARGKYGLVHNIGLGGAVVVSLLRRPEFYHADGPDGRDRCGQGQIQVALGRAIATCKVMGLRLVQLGWDVTDSMRRGAPLVRRCIVLHSAAAEQDYVSYSRNWHKSSSLVDRAYYIAL